MQLYLNNNGSRWTDTDKNERRFILVLSDGTRKERLLDYWESFGNFASCSFRYCGKRYSRLPHQKDEKTGLPIIFLNWRQAYI